MSHLGCYVSTCRDKIVAVDELSKFKAKQNSLILARSREIRRDRSIWQRQRHGEVEGEIVCQSLINYQKSVHPRSSRSNLTVNE